MSDDWDIGRTTTSTGHVITTSVKGSQSDEDAEFKRKKAAAERQKALTEMGYGGLAGPAKLTREAKAAGKDYKAYEEEKYQEWKKKRALNAGQQLDALKQ